MKQKALALLLAMVMALPFLPATAEAAEYSADNFVRIHTYTGQFSDLAETSTFYQNVAALYEYGLSVGKADGTFGLTDSVTVGQILIFAGRIRSLYAFGDPEAGPSVYAEAAAPLSRGYLRYLQAEGVLGSELDGFYAAPATRAQVAHVLANTLPEEALPAINLDLVTQAYATRQYIPDVTEYTAYYWDILRLYNCGLSIGSDEFGSFHPDLPITRGAAAAILTRMVDPSLRMSPAWTLPTDQTAAGLRWADLVTGTAVYIPSPNNYAELESSINYMLAQDTSVLKLSYPHPIQASFVSRLMEQSLSIVKAQCEQLYNSVNCSYDPNAGTVILTFSAVSAGDNLKAYRDFTLQAAIAVHDLLWENGSLTSDMTEYEKAQVYYTWVCENCTYDYQAVDNSLSHIAYSLFADGIAVCDGYTGAYNLLLKLEDIQCTALSNQDHIWTVASLDGVEYHIDTTWGDSGNEISYNYFGMSPQQSWQYHSW